MKVIAFEVVDHKKHLPLQSCGGIVVKPNETLLVRADMAQAVERQAPWLKRVGELERDTLKHGAYELQARRALKEAPGAPKPKEEAAKPKAEPAAAPAPSGDRSMAGVGKGKGKRK